MTTDKPNIDELLRHFFIMRGTTDIGDNFWRIHDTEDVDEVFRNALHSMLIEAENRGGVRMLKELWNAHTPDVVPGGWEPDSPVLKDIQHQLNVAMREEKS